MDSKLRQYLFATAVSILLASGGCAATRLYARMDKVEDKLQGVDKDTAIIKQDVEDFRKSFEEFKQDVKVENARHHR